MKIRFLWIAATLLLSACHATAGAAGDVEARVTRELDRLAAVQTKLEAGGVPEIVKQSVAPNRAALERVRKTASPQLRLYRLRDAFVGIESVAFVAEQKEATKSTDAFVMLWKARPVQAVAAPAGAPLVHEALVQSSSNRAEKLYRASLPYGKADGPFSGVYYLGEAHANAAFARFVASLGARVAEAPPDAKVLNAAIDAMETDMLRTFEKDPAAPNMIPVSVRLKEARELLDRGSLAGATLLLLEARLTYGHATAPATGAPAAPAAEAPADLPRDSMAELWRASDNPIASHDVLPFYVSLRRQS